MGAPTADSGSGRGRREEGERRRRRKTGGEEKQHNGTEQNK